MARAPLVVRSVVVGRHYIAAAVITTLGVFILALWGFDVLRPPPLIIIVSVLLLLGGPVIAANTFLGYPQLIVAGNRLVLKENPFAVRRLDLAGLGAAYVTKYQRRRGIHTALVFRSAVEEAAHRAAEPYPYAPEIEEAAANLTINAVVGGDIDKAEELAAEINRHRGLVA